MLHVERRTSNVETSSGLQDSAGNPALPVETLERQIVRCLVYSVQSQSRPFPVPLCNVDVKSNLTQWMRPARMMDR